jgi:PKD repeat protein
VLLLWALPSAAGAAAGFIPAQTLAGAGSPTDQVASAMAPNGYAAAAWAETIGGGQSAIEVAVRPPGGPWSSPQQLDLASPNGGRPEVSVAVDSAGDAAVAWDDEMVDNTTHVATFNALVSTRSAGHAFDTPQTITGAIQPVVGIDQSGKVIMIDTESNNEFVREWMIGRLPGSGQQIGTSCEYYLSALAVAATGAALAGLECNGPTFVRRSTSGTWTSSNVDPDNFNSCGSMTFGSATSNFATDVQVGIDSQGNPAGVFLENQRTQQCGLLLNNDTLSLYLVEPAGAGVALANPAVATAMNSEFSGPTLSAPDIAVGGGSELVSWNGGQIGSSLDQNVQFFSLTGASSGSPQTVSSANVVSRGEVALSASGFALDAFGTSGSGSTTNLSAAFRAPGGPFGSPARLANGATGVTDVIDGAGDGLVAFEQGSIGPAGAQVSSFDATPPTITSASIPSAATIGAPLQFSAAATDFWGPVMLSWAFGDGAAATGASVTHTFAVAGTSTVTVTATDAVGNTAARSGSVVVTAPGGVLAAAALSNVSVNPRAFAPDRTGTGSIARKSKTGTTISYTDTQAATTTFTVLRPQPGVKRGKRCVKPSKRERGKRARRCTRYVPVGSFTHTDLPGPNRFHFSGRVGRRKLKAGNYRLDATPRAHGTTGKTVSATFRIIR